MKSISTFFACLLGWTCCLNLSSNAHDTWIQSGPLVTRQGDVVHVDLMLGNHGNKHRDFKIASKVTLAPCTLEVIAPDGTKYDLKEKVVDVGFGPKEGFWSARHIAGQAGVHQVVHTLDTLHGTSRAIKSGKTFFIATKSFPIDKEVASNNFLVLGKGIEFLLHTPLSSISAGKELQLQLVRNGKPLSGVVVSFIPRGAKLSAGLDPDYERTTDEEGKVSYTPQEGNWLLAVAHFAAPEEKGDGYDQTHYSATLVLPIPQVPYK